VGWFVREEADGVHVIPDSTEVDSSEADALIRAAGVPYARRVSIKPTTRWWDHRPWHTVVFMPNRKNLEADEWNCALMHELVHAMGIRRGTLVQEGAKRGARTEERVAEYGSQILCEHYGWPAPGHYREALGPLVASERDEIRARLSLLRSLVLANPDRDARLRLPPDLG
jgi:antirestriction protein ArdC